MTTPLYFLIHRGAALECVQAVSSSQLLIGRSESSEIWLPDNSVSRRHASIVVNTRVASIKDLNSRNGTFVNGQRVRASVELCEEDTIQVADYRLVVFYSIGSVIREMSHLEESTWTEGNAGEPGDPLNSRAPYLTPAQRRVLAGFVDGLQEKEVAARLNLSIHTIHTHAKAIYKAFNISSRAELLCHYGIQHGRSDGLKPESPPAIIADGQ